MSISQRVRLQHIREIHALVGRLLDCGNDPRQWRTMALEGMKKLIGGQVGLTVDMRIEPDGAAQLIDPIDVGWQSESVRRRYQQYVLSGEMQVDPLLINWEAAQRRAAYVCRTREQLVDDKTWYAAPSVSEARRMGDVNSFIISTAALSPQAIQGFIVYRAWSDKPFEPRHRRIVKLFHLELARAHRAAVAAATRSTLPRLSPRLQQTLDLLLTPLTLKEIAARLGLSRHTINDYQKALYARFEVTSRVELLHKHKALSAREGLQLPAGLLRESSAGAGGEPVTGA